MRLLFKKAVNIMVFSSYKFIFFFFPVVYIVYSLLRKGNKISGMKWWLILSSLFFYGFGNLKIFPILVGTALFNFVISSSLQSDKVKNKGLRGVLFAVGILENLALLFYFKYRNFFFENVNLIFGTDFTMKNIILPLGISFYTFQLISYITDSYNKDAKGYKFTDYMVFVTFFPHLIVGPIALHDKFMPQLSGENLAKYDSKNIMLGILLFAIGCFKKTVIADPLIAHASEFYALETPSGLINAWSAVLSYTFAYYFDFSGYIDMALGLGRLFNIELAQNFNSPYKARNFADFWRRWNITISEFLNDKVFKNIFHFGNGIIKLIFATLITFIVSGIWHGVGYHYIWWGIANGVFVCFANIMTLHRKKLPFPIAWALTFFFSVLVRVLFDSFTTIQAIEVYKVMFTPVSNLGEQLSLYLSQNTGIVILLILSAIITFGFKNSNEIADNFKPGVKYAIFSAFLLALSLFSMGQVSNFLYFQF